MARLSCFVCLLLAITTLSGSLLSGIATAQEVTLLVAVDRPLHATSPRLYGISLEDINFGGDGGLNSALVKNGGFELVKDEE